MPVSLVVVMCAGCASSGDWALIILAIALVWTANSQHRPGSVVDLASSAAAPPGAGRKMRERAAVLIAAGSAAIIGFNHRLLPLWQRSQALAGR
jgi:hypothetical protein